MDDEHLVAIAPGFDDVHIYATAASVPVVNPQASQPYFALPLVDGGAVGRSTGGTSPAPPSIMATAIGVARADHAAHRARFPGDFSDAYDAQQTIIASNTQYTPFEGLMTPVSRVGTGRGVRHFPMG